MKYDLLGMAALMTCGTMQSCTTANGMPDINDKEELVDLASQPVRMELTDEQKVFATDNNGFTLNFLKAVNDADRRGKGFIYSPLSITYVLGMVNDAAVGTTREELEKTLGFRAGDIEAVNNYCKNLIYNLPKVDERVQLNIANAIFVNKKYTLKEQFQKDMQDYYDAKAEALDFGSQAALSRINGWCNEKTKSMIPKILDDVNKDAVSYLLNAIYFKADWATKFKKENTKTETFTTDDGTVELPLMHQSVLIRYLKNDTFSAVNIPYGNGMWSMAVMLPEEGKTTDDIINLLAADGWSAERGEGLMSKASTYEVDLKLPRFETNSDTDELEGSLTKILDGMGIHLAFNAYLSQIPNMCEDNNLYIQMMRQKAVIKVNEEGSEAAAVTVAGMMKTTAVEPQHPRAVFHANRPFVYVIREASSGVILFAGKFTGK